MNLSFRNQSHIHLNCKAEPVTITCRQQHSVANNKYHRYFKNSNKAHCYLFSRNLLGKTTLQTKKMLRTEVLAQSVPPMCKRKSHNTQ